MNEYFDIVESLKDKIVIETMLIIDNKTLVKTYRIATNLHVDYGIGCEMYTNTYTKSKSKFNKRLALYKKATGLKLKLCRVDNDSSYTRLVYCSK